ncbi:MAG: UvrD-helicase domain-containing protein [Desulfobacterales bacterium]|nr:UvrD-helicase domain-containing protein [Desulfobacterales bacterium]
MTLPPDHEARKLALDITQSHHVEAPAGSGKTMLLVARFIKLLGAVRHPNEILALTFTNKAAGEMKTRMAGIFLKVEQGLPAENSLEESLLEGAKKALKQHEAHRFLLLCPEGLQVMTFHGFCYSLVKRAPLEAGVPPESIVIEDAEQDLLVDEAVQEAIYELLCLSEDTPERRAFDNRLLRLNNRLPSLADELKDLVKRRDLFLDLVQALRAHPDLGAFEAALSESLGGLVSSFLSEAAAALQGSTLGSNWNALWQHLKEKGAPNVDFLPETLPQTAWPDLSSWQAIAEVLTTKGGKPRQRMGPASGGFYKGFSAGPWGNEVKELPSHVVRMLSELKNLPGPDAPPTDINALADLIILAARTISAYEKKCRQRHVLDFVGLEQAALRILGEESVSDLQLFLDHRIGHLLVDEFQDTSRSQWTLIQQLCAGWAPADGRTVFLVGDPKQSIYSFRKAEVRLFLEAKKGIPLSGQGVLPVANIGLGANFRSAAPLVSFTNQLFGRTVMAGPKASFDEVPFQPSSAAITHTPPSLHQPPVSLNIFFEHPAVASPQEAEARWLAQTVSRIIAERSRAVSIGILLFARTRLSCYLRALRDTGTPVRVKEGLRVADQPEVIHLRQLAAALCRPHDDLAWASIVRSPWVWIDAGVLAKVARMGPAPWPSKIKLAAGEHPELDRLKRALDAGRQRLGRGPLAQVVLDVWMAVEGAEKVAACFGTEGVANCRCFFEVLESIETGIPEETLVRLDHTLESLYAPEAPDAAGAGVDLMTVHGAKGLEFDVVFLPFLDWRPLAAGKAPAYLLERSPGGSGLPLIAMGADRRLGEPEPGYSAIMRLYKGRKLAEAKRLLYVGITRARKELFLSGLATNTQSGPKPPENSPMALLLEHTAKEQGGPVATFFNPLAQVVPAKKDKKMPSLPRPIPFEQQPVPYLMETPSELAGRTVRKEAAAKDVTEGYHAAIRGTVTHRLIESLWRNGKLPPADRIATALAAEGMNPDQAAGPASEIEAELRACLNEAFFKRLLDRTSPGGKSEWAMEAVKQPEMIRAGILDFVRQDGKNWWIVDFKTSRPEAGQAEEDFLKQEAAGYRPQLTAYRDMLAKKEGIDPGQIRVALYFTSIQKCYEVAHDR